MSISNFGELKTSVQNWLGGRSDQTSRIPEWIKLAEDRIAQDLRIRAMEASADMLWKATTSITADEVAGTANAITFTPATAATSYAFADTYKYTSKLDNTGSSGVTVEISSLGTRAIKKYEEGAKQALEAGDLRNSIGYRLYDDGTDFILTPPGGAPLPTRFVALRRQYLDVETGRRLPFVSATTFWYTAAASQSSQPEMFTIEGDLMIVAPITASTISARALIWKRFATLSADSDTNWIIDNAGNLLLYGALLEAATYLKDGADVLKYANLYEDMVDRIKEADRKDRYPAGPLESRSDVAGP